MFILKSLNKFGEYILLMGKVFSIPDRWSEFFRRYIMEVYQLVIDSIAIVVTISLFIGAVIAIQTSLNIMSPLIPPYTVGLITRDTLLLEFSSSIMCLILAGKIGSNIASEIGTMRVTEQIDALDIMGVNSANYLILNHGISNVYPHLGSIQHVYRIIRRVSGKYFYINYSDIPVCLRTTIIF